MDWWMRLRKNPVVWFFIQYSPVIGAVAVVICFVFTRLPFFLHYRLPDVAVDYWSYSDIVQQCRQGQWPKLYLRTPGYPLFLAIVSSISRGPTAVVVAQCVVTLTASLVTLVCLVRADRRLAYPAAFALIGFTASMHSVWFDTALMSESLYCSLLMLSVGTLALAVLRGSAKVYAVASLSMAACLLTRPAGFFLFGVFGLALAWFLFQRRPRRDILAFSLPFAIILLIVCAYNRLTIGSFTVTPFGAVNLLGAVATYIEEDPSAPESVNEAVRNIRNGITPEDRMTVFTSRDPDALMRVFTTYYDAAIYTHMAKTSIGYMELTQIYKRLGRLSIRQHPDIYLKFVGVNFYQFYRHALLNRNHDHDFYNDLPVRYNRYPAPHPHIRRVGEQVVVDATWSRRLHERFNQVHEAIFWRAIWLLGALLLFPVAIWRLIRSRARDAGAFLVFACVLALLGAGLIVALVQMPMTRYGATALFFSYLSPLYLCLLTRSHSNTI